MRLEHDPVGEQRVQHGGATGAGRPPTSRAASPGPGRRSRPPSRARSDLTAGGSVSAAASSGVTPGAREPRRPSRTITARPSSASSLGQRDRPVPGLAEQDGAGEALRQVVEYRREQPGQRDRAGQLVPGVLADAVGDPHVQAELAEDVGHRVVDGSHRGCRHHLPRPRAEIDEQAGPGAPAAATAAAPAAGAARDARAARRYPDGASGAPRRVKRRRCRRRCPARRRGPRGSATGTGPLLPARSAASHAGRRSRALGAGWNRCPATSACSLARYLIKARDRRCLPAPRSRLARCPGSAWPA